MGFSIYSICRRGINMARTATVTAFWHFCSQVAGESRKAQKINKDTPTPQQTGKLNLLELGIKAGLGQRFDAVLIVTNPNAMFSNYTLKIPSRMELPVSPLSRRSRHLEHLQRAGQWQACSCAGRAPGCLSLPVTGSEQAAPQGWARRSARVTATSEMGFDRK